MEIEAVPERSESLLVAHREGDADAFAKLVEHYRRSVFGYLVRCGVADGDRDDLFQEIFIKIHRRAHQYDPDRPLHPWLFTVVANTVRTHLKKERIKKFFVWGQPIPEVEDDAPDVEAAASAKETEAWLKRAIRALPMPQREVLILASIENVPLKDIASILDIPVNTVKTHVRRARMRLVESYERRTRQSHE